jgi:hypothetical protein
MIQEIKKVKQTVKELLINEPKLRDNDRLLIMRVWLDQAPYLRKNSSDFSDFAYGFVEGKFASPESIRRSRALLQKEHPSLRGEIWHKRRKLGQQTQIEINN